MSFDEIWNETMNSLENFIKTNERRPSQYSKDNIEKSLKQWMSNQNQNYKKKIHSMKDETKYNLWTEFLEKYKKYFKNNDEIESTSSSPTIDYVEQENKEEKEVPIKVIKKSMKLSPPSLKTKEPTTQNKERIKTEISILHQKYKTMNSENLHHEFNKNKELWDVYHNISETNEQSFPPEQIPRNRIIKELDKIKTKRTKRVVDMGCGKGQIANHFKNDKRFQFINYDHVSSNQSIVSCDISKMPLEDHEVEICILCLAMWGSNCKDYLKEANRILETGGKLYIVEPTKRWSETTEIGQEAKRLKSLLEECGYQIVPQIEEKTIEKFSLFVCIRN
jgi:ubiquinone/menaquinone biosynthesis C-methylase UbiE